MTCRAISETQALAILRILYEECGMCPTKDNGDQFVRSIVVPSGTLNAPGCGEYRFQGELGFGGKFRNNGNCNNTPYVDCYGDDLTDARQQMINRANERIAALFKEE